MLLSQVNNLILLTIARTGRWTREGTSNAAISCIGCVYLEGLEFINCVSSPRRQLGYLLHGALSILVHSVPGTWRTCQPFKFVRLFDIAVSHLPIGRCFAIVEPVVYGQICITIVLLNHAFSMNFHVGMAMPTLSRIAAWS